jgi:hypothetical protein
MGQRCRGSRESGTRHRRSTGTARRSWIGTTLIGATDPAVEALVRLQHGGESLLERGDELPALEMGIQDLAGCRHEDS